MKKATKKEIEELRAFFLDKYPDSKTELNYRNLYELIICVALAAQCTDKRVNVITPALFERFPDPESLYRASLEEVTELIKTCSFFNNKAKNLLKMAKAIMEDYDGVIPEDPEGLKSLPGVGQKTCNVVLIEYKGADVMAVDTHVFRVSHRLGLSYAKTPNETEKELTKKFKTNLHQLHQGLVLFGRYHCKALKPMCDDCEIAHLCKNPRKSFKAS